MRPFHPDAEGPLDGIRVLDLSRLVAGNMLSLQLADFGAEVIKIEDPGKGDPLRDWRIGGIAFIWKVYARNKKSVTLGLREREGSELLLRLAERRPGLIENFRPGTLETHGARRRRRCMQHNPRLIIVRVSGWGQDGPYRDRPGFGTWSRACRALPPRPALPTAPPVLPPLALADMVAGLYGVVGGAGRAARDRGQAAAKGRSSTCRCSTRSSRSSAPDAAIFKLTGEVHAAARQPLGQHRRRATCSRPGTAAGSRSRPPSRGWRSGCFAPSAAPT